MMVFGADVANGVVIKASSLLGMLTGGGLVAQALPVIPDDFKSWPITAMLSFLALCALALAFYAVKMSFTKLGELTKVVSKGAEEQAASNEIQRDTNEKLGEVVHEMRQTNLNLAGRPCIKP